MIHSGDRNVRISLISLQLKPNLACKLLPLLTYRLITNFGIYWWWYLIWVIKIWVIFLEFLLRCVFQDDSICVFTQAILSWVYVSVPVLSWVYVSVPVLSWVYVSVPVLSWVYVSVPVLSWVYVSVPVLVAYYII